MHEQITSKPMLAVTLINILVVAISVIVHYEFLYHATKFIPKMVIRHRFRIVFGVSAALVAHTFEIWIFGVAYYYMNKAEQWGSLQGNTDGSLLDCVYFSFTTFTTLGFGDIEPMGYVRFLTGIESLTGLVLITWSASFLYYEMQRYWNSN